MHEAHAVTATSLAHMAPKCLFRSSFISTPGFRGQAELKTFFSCFTAVFLSQLLPRAYCVVNFNMLLLLCPLFPTPY